MNFYYLQRLVLLHLSLPEPVVLQRRLVAGDGVDAPGEKKFKFQLTTSLVSRIFSLINILPSYPVQDLALAVLEPSVSGKALSLEQKKITQEICFSFFGGFEENK